MKPGMMGVVMMFMAMSAMSASGAPLPAGGEEVLPVETTKAVVFSDSTKTQPAATLQVVAVQGQAFTQALEVNVPASVTGAGLIQGLIKTAQPVDKGQVCLLRFWMRTLDTKDETGEGQVRIYFQLAAAPWTKSIQYTAQTREDWRLFELAFTSADRYAPGQAELGLAFGPSVQKVQVGGIQVLKYPAGVKLSDLPRMNVTYAGREADAPWRKPAAERIAKYRMADLRVSVVDAQGKPVPGATVAVTQQRHEFRFGTAVATPGFLDPGADGQKYRALLLELFNHATPENGMKWPAWNNEWGPKHSRESTLQLLAWLKEHQFTIHGHVLVWPGWNNLPKTVAALKNDPPALRRAIQEHIVSQVGQLQSYISEWDVLNEPFTNQDVVKVLGKEAMVEWFQTARQAAPGMKLLLNDFGILESGRNTDTPHHRFFEKTIQYLLDQKAPLDGLGLQSHFGSDVTPPAKVLTVIDRLAKFGKPMYVTEFDIDTDDEQMQADYTRDFLTLIFSRPEFEAFIMWGFWEGKHWRPRSAMYRRDWEEKPNARVYRDLVFKQWWTRAQGRTDAGGAYAVRAFRGVHEVTVQIGGRSPKQTVTLPADGAAVIVRLD